MIEAVEVVEVEKMVMMGESSDTSFVPAPRAAGVLARLIRPVYGMAEDMMECVGKVAEVAKMQMVIEQGDRIGSVADNYRPIACLPLMWKLLTGIFGH